MSWNHDQPALRSRRPWQFLDFFANGSCWCADANNCGCNEHQNVASWGPPQTTGKLKFGKGPLTDGLYHYQSEVQATIDFGFDVSSLSSLLPPVALLPEFYTDGAHVYTMCTAMPQGIKLDGCGEFLNLTVFADLLNKTGKPILIENW